MASDRESERAREEREREREGERETGRVAWKHSFDIHSENKCKSTGRGFGHIYRVSVYRVDFELV